MKERQVFSPYSRVVTGLIPFGNESFLNSLFGVNLVQKHAGERCLDTIIRAWKNYGPLTTCGP